MPGTMLITGCSSGLGASIAAQSAAAGYTVYATMRDTTKRDALDAAVSAAGASVEVLPLDVRDTVGVEACVATILERHGSIDVLVNNAGVGFVRSTEQATEEDIQWVTDVNYLGVVRCTKAVLPHMRAARSGRVVSVSSVGGLVGQPFNEIYCASKFAVEGYMEGLASYVGPFFNIGFSIVEPGGIHSEFATNALQHFASTGGMLEDEYKPIIERYLAGSRLRGQSAFQTSDEVAAVVLETVQSPNPPVRVRTSEWAEALCALKTSADPDGLLLRDQVVEQFLGGGPDA